MAKTYRILALPVLTLALAASVLYGQLGATAAPSTDGVPGRAQNVTPADGRITPADWQETGITRGNPTGSAHAVK